MPVIFKTSPETTENDVAEKQQTVKLFYAPSVTIKAGSRVEVTQNGVTTVYRQSGIEKVYESHKEAELITEERYG